MHKKALLYINKLNVEECRDKIAIITGGNSGIGFESAKYLCYIGMQVIIAVRSQERGQKAVDQIKNENPNAKITMMLLDQSNETSIRNFADEIIKKKIDVYLFYNNAGVYRLPFELVENKDIITSTNYYGPLMLISLLLPYFHSLNHDVKVVFTSSLAAGYTSYKKLSVTPNEKQSRVTRYANSKLLDAFLFKYLFNKDNSNVKYYAVHPGLAKTNLIKKTYKGKITKVCMNIFLFAFSNPLWKSSLSILRVLDSDSKDGSFYGPTHFFHFLGYPKDNKFLNRKYKNVDKIIKQSEEVAGFQLI